MDCIAGGLWAWVSQRAERAREWSLEHWKAIYLIMFVSIVVSVLVGVQLRTQGQLRLTASAWFTGMGTFAVLTVYKDSWDVKFPYCLLLGPPLLVCRVLRSLSQVMSPRREVVGCGRDHWHRFGGHSDIGWLGSCWCWGVSCSVTIRVILTG